MGVNKAALADSSFLGKFNGKCYKCEKTGHRAANCPNRNSGGSGSGNGGGNGGGRTKFTGTCNNCG